MTCSIEKAQHEVVMQEAAADPIRKAQILSQSAQGRAAFLSFIPAGPVDLLQDWELSSILFFQLGLSYFPALRSCPLCGEGPSASGSLDPFHAFSCPGSTGNAKTVTHDLLRDVLHSFLLELNPYRAIIIREPRPYPGSDRRPDLLTLLNYVLSHLDVSVTHPTCRTYLRAAQSPLGAANERAKRKTASYLRLGVVPSAKVHIVPFVLETFGGVHEEARAFIAKAAKLHARPAQWSRRLYQALSVTLQRGNARVFAEWNLQVQAHGHGVDIRAAR